MVKRVSLAERPDGSAIIATIATETGLSPRTVLRLLVQPTIDTRPSIRARSDKVRQLAATLGYRPNAAARATRSGGLPLVALVQRAETDFMPFQLTAGLTDALGDDRELVVTRVPGPVVGDPTAGPRLLRELLVSGVVIHASQAIPQTAVSAVESLGIPAVWVNQPGGSDCIWPDEQSGSAQLTRMLLERGHRRIVWFEMQHLWQGAPEHYSVGERRAGYLAAMTAAGLAGRQVHRSYVSSGSPLQLAWGTPADDRIAVARALLQVPNRPTAIISPSMDSLGPVFLAAAQLGLAVPSDLSLCCIDTQVTSTFGALVTTAVIPFYETGRAAIARLDAWTAGGLSRKGVAVPYGQFEGRTIAAR